MQKLSSRAALTLRTTTVKTLTAVRGGADADPSRAADSVALEARAKTKADSIA